MRFQTKIIALNLLLVLAAVGAVSTIHIMNFHRAYHEAILHHRENILSKERQRIRELTGLAVQLAELFQQRVEAGELSEEEAKRTYLDRLSEFRYDKGDGYFWTHELGPASDDTGLTVVMHPSQPNVIGTLIADYVDLEMIDTIVVAGQKYGASDPALAELGIAPTQFLVKMNEMVRQKGEGFVTYFWLKPKPDGTMSVEGYEKLSFVRELPKWNWVIGSGVYLAEIEQNIAADYKSLAETTMNQLHQTILLTLVIVLLAVIASVILARLLSRSVTDLNRQARAVSDGEYNITVTGKEPLEFRRVLGAFQKMASAVESREAELKKRAEQLSQSIVELEDSNTRKDAILAAVSHELRTPVITIAGLCELMNREKYGPLQPKQKEKLQTCIRKTEDLLKLIDDLLHMRTANGQMRERERLAVEDIVNESVEDHLPDARKSNISIDTVVDDCGLYINAVRHEVGRAIQNLIMNAVKFSDPDSRITVRIAKDGDRVQIEVSDQGIGIDSRELENIFEPFYQVDSSLGRKYGGLGLGLALTKEFSLRNDGEIRVKSRVGKGSTFTIDFPLSA